MAGLTNMHDLRQGYDPEPMIKACVKVFVTMVTPSYAMPWARGEEARSTGSGFVVTLPGLGDGDDLHAGAAAAAAGSRCMTGTLAT